MSSSNKPSLLRSQRVASVSSSALELGQRLGYNVYLYFNFLNFIIFVNGILFAINFYDYFNFYSSLTAEEKARIGFLDVLFTSAYPSSHRSSWITANYISMLFAIISGPLYIVYFFKNKDQLKDKMKVNPSSSEIIEENLLKVDRFYTSYLLFGALIGLLFAIAFGLSFIQEKVVVKGNIYTDEKIVLLGMQLPISYKILVSVAITVIIAVLSMIFTGYAKTLTDYANHKTHTQYRKHLLLKVIATKLVSVYSISFSTADTGKSCPLHVVGQEYLILFLLDFTVSNFVEVVLPIISMIVGSFQPANKAIVIKEESREVFECDVEYLELIYRQYLLYNAMTAFPMVTMLNFFGNVLEIIIDKFRLLYVCNYPANTGTGNAFQTFLGAMLSVVALFSFTHPACGSIYLLSGNYHWCHSNNCAAACSVWK